MRIRSWFLWPQWSEVYGEHVQLNPLRMDRREYRRGKGGAGAYQIRRDCLGIFFRPIIAVSEQLADDAIGGAALGVYDRGEGRGEEPIDLARMLDARGEHVIRDAAPGHGVDAQLVEQVCVSLDLGR